jgi:uncharacterized membrane protein
MKRRRGILTLVLAGVTLAVLVLSVPGSAREALERGNFYVFSEAFFEDLPKRLVGPGRFRFVLQPLIATILGIRNGIVDARMGRPPYLWGLLTKRGLRRELWSSGCSAVVNLVLMGILVDSICQWLLFGTSYPGAALVVGPVLIGAPYGVARALANRGVRLGGGRSKCETGTMNRGAIMKTKVARRRLTETSMWRIPMIYVVVTFLVGLMFPRVEHYLLPGLVTTMSAAAAMGICGAVASGMIALTGIVFSLTFVMVQFSATAYSPRLVLWVARDPVVSHALGIFIATFLYALIVLGWVDRNGMGNVPLLSSWLVVGLLLASMGSFIALIERIGRLKVSRMLIFTGNYGRAAIEGVFRPVAGVPREAEREEYRNLPVTQTLAHVGPPQAIQAVRAEDLVELAAAAGAVIEVTETIGDSVLETVPLVRVYGAREQLNERALRAAVELGDERTFEQDPKYAIRLLVDIAIKALSPAINDPTTAVQALDQIEDLLMRLGRCELEIGHYRDGQGALRVVIPFPRWEDYVRLALDEIQFCGANSVQVTRRTLALIKSLLAVLPVERHAALRQWEERIQATIVRSFEDTEQRREAAVADRQGLGLGEEKRGEGSAAGWEGRMVPTTH